MGFNYCDIGNTVAHDGRLNDSFRVVLTQTTSLIYETCLHASCSVFAIIMSLNRRIHFHHMSHRRLEQFLFQFLFQLLFQCLFQLPGRKSQNWNVTFDGGSNVIYLWKVNNNNNDHNNKKNK